jgi:hypothetical protein
MTSISTSPVVDRLPQASPGLSEGPSPRLNSPGPLPLPDFKFPARRTSSTFPSSAPASFSRATGRRPLSTFELKGPQNEGSSTTETLPQFTFGSQPASPRTIPRPLTAQSHQRNLSEYIGADLATPSISPTKSEHNLPPPSASRRHAHRRSAAISQNDLSLILKPGPSSPRGSSAPTSPAGSHGLHTTQFSASLDSAVQPTTDTEPSPSPEDNLPSKAIKNTRVGFSDDVQIIPRPLSLVSSDSASTVRPGHSVSNSMSSIMSGTSSPPPKEKRSLTPGNRLNDTRPRTAEPILDREQSISPNPPAPKRRGSLPLLSDTLAAGLPSPSTPRSAKKWSFFGLETASGESSPKSRPTSASSSVKESKKVVISEPELVQGPDTDAPVVSTEHPGSRRSSISRKPSKKQKKVRSWAGSILGRKSRQRSQKQKLNRRSPTPPLRTFTPMDDVESFDFNQVDRTAPARPELNTDFTTWKPRKLPPQEESMSPIIDLDAALGPFNTPSSFGEDWDSSQRPGTRKRAMHSAAGLAGFTGPGMHYHRRAESAPEFENPRFGLHRLGSSSTMAMEDVFEEDEDEWEDTKASSDKESSIKANETDDDAEIGLGIDIKVVDSEGMDATKQMDFDEESFCRVVKRKGSGSSDGERRNVGSNKSEHSAMSLIDEPIEEEESNVEIADDSIPPRPDSRAQSSDSTATPPFRPSPAKDLSPVDIQPFSLQLPYPTPTSPRSTTQSSFPSPRSPFSYDAQRISTAPSSITDENAFQSLLLGEPGPELRMSVDDVPSLTSSNSTMTRESMVFPGAGNPQFRDGQRSASLSSAAVSRKRSSMASLSRLISSSHGEKSKLSIESRAPSPIDGEKKEKTSKGKRISRMMQFWKPKETS